MHEDPHAEGLGVHGSEPENPTATHSEAQQLSGVTIVLDCCTVRIVGDIKADNSTHLPRRQSFAWPADAHAYAERLSRDRGSPIGQSHG